MEYTLMRHLGRERSWNWLLGIPTRLRKGWDSYGEWMPDRSRSYYMTGRYGFTGYWRAGRLPNTKLTEAMTFSSEDCDIKEKWKRMLIWNYLFDCDRETLELMLEQTKCERKHHVILRMLEAQTYKGLDERVAAQHSVRNAHKMRFLKKAKARIKRKLRKRQPELCHKLM